MSPDLPISSPVAEPVFSSGDVTRMAGITSRQLQWLDEQEVVSPRMEDHRRRYCLQEVLEILTVAALRRKGISLQKTRRLLRLLRRDLGQHFAAIATGPVKIYLLTDGETIQLEDQAVVIEKLSAAREAMYLVCLSDLFKTITPHKPVRRRRNRQLELF
jgi:DNA-binding transcriptional MerR regulator